MPHPFGRNRFSNQSVSLPTTGVGRWHRTVVSKAKVLGADSGTEVVNLSKSNFISNLYLRVFNTNGSTSNRVNTETIEQDITNIKIVGNGSKVYKSYDGEDCRKFAQLRYGDLPPMDETQAGSGVQSALFPIQFGRYDGDTDYILPAKLHSTLQLKFDWAFTDSTTVGFTTSETNAKYDLIMEEWVSADNARNKKILVETEQDKFTSVATGNQDVDLALGNVYRKIIVHAYEAAVEDGTDITDVELRINNGSTIPFSDSWDMLQQSNAYENNIETTKKFIVDLKDNSTYSTRVTKILRANAIAFVDKHFSGIDAVTGDQVTLNVYDLATPTAISTEEGQILDIQSPFMSSCVFLDFDRLNDGKQLLSTLGLQDLKLRLTQGGAGATVKTLTQEVMSANTI